MAHRLRTIHGHRVRLKPPSLYYPLRPDIYGIALSLYARFLAF